MTTKHRINIDMEKIASLYRSGMSVREVADHFHVSHTLIRFRLKEMNIKCRTISESNTGKHYKASVKVTWTCPVCTKTFMLNPSRAVKKKYCSRACYGVWRKSLGLSGPIPTKIRAERNCKVCGKPFIAKGTRNVKEQKFCSTACARKFNHHRRWGFTVPERIIHALLIGMGITFETEKMIGEYRIDIFLPLHNMGIECDGDYWHSLSISMKVALKRDLVFKDLGLTVLHLKEETIKKDVAFCKSQIENSIKSANSM